MIIQYLNRKFAAAAQASVYGQLGAKLSRRALPRLEARSCMLVVLSNSKYTKKDGGEGLSPNLSVCQAIEHAPRTSNNNPELPIWPTQSGADELRPLFFAFESGTGGGNVREHQRAAVEVELI